MNDWTVSALALAALVWGATPATAGAEESGDVEHNADAADERADGREGEPETDDPFGEPDAYPAPGPYRVAVGLSGGRVAWDTPQGSRSTEWLYGATGRYVFLKPLFASLSVDHSRYAPRAGDLVVGNRHLAALAGVGAEGWFSPFRVAGQLQGGTIVRMLELDDRAGTEVTETKVRPTWGGQVAVGAGLFGTAALNFTLGMRSYAPGRLDISFGARLEWIFSN